MKNALLLFAFPIFLAVANSPALASDLGTAGYAQSGEIKIHYVTNGKGPLVLLVHGFPDYWYTWRDQMPALAKHFQVAAIDLRGYNKSGQPKGVNNYKVQKLLEDVEAVRKHFKREKLTIVGHDWGGFIAWSYAMTFPQRTEKLIALNLPHPKGVMRELANNTKQKNNAQYARNFQKPGAEKLLSPAVLAMWVKEPDARKKYVAAFKRSSITAMLNYYKANYPQPPYKKAAQPKFPKVKCPVLLIHGLKDQFVMAAGLNDNWNWVEKDLTLVTVPNAGHFVHRDESAFVTRAMVRWLTRDGKE